jgi:hypothetical protein
VERHLRVLYRELEMSGTYIVYNLPTLIIVLGSNLGVLRGFMLTERIDVEVFISISLILYFDIPWLARHVWEVVPGAVGEALVSDGAQFCYLLVDGIMVHQTGRSHESNRQKHETDQPLAPAQPHVAR